MALTFKAELKDGYPEPNPEDSRFIATGKCPLCDSSERKAVMEHDGDPYLHAIDKDLIRWKLQWWFCEECGMVYQDPQLTKEALDAYYFEGYRKHEPSKKIIEGKLKDSARLVDFIQDWWNPDKMSGKCLDIGSGEGCLAECG